MAAETEQVAILGLGLIGGSIAAGLRRRRNDIRLTAWDRDTGSLAAGLDAGLIDAGGDSPASAVDGADLIIVSVPVLAMESVFTEIAPVLAEGRAVVTDVGSVKGHVLDAASRIAGRVPPWFVPGHPIAGSERHGVGAADPDLFDRHKVILTPAPETDPAATARVRWMWELLGARVVEMEPAHHDVILAQTSHLPHLLAYALVDTLSSGGDSLEIFEYAAGGFRDFSRIAASDPVMWRDIFRTNAGPVLDVLDRFRDRLDAMQAMIRDGRMDELAEVLARSKAARDHFSKLIEERNRQS